MSSDESFSLHLSSDSDSENQTFEKFFIESIEQKSKVKNSEQNLSNQGVHKEIHFDIAPKCLENLVVLNTPASSKGSNNVTSSDRGNAEESPQRQSSIERLLIEINNNTDSLQTIEVSDSSDSSVKILDFEDADTTVKSKKVNLKKRRKYSRTSSSKVLEGLLSRRFSRVKRRRIINITSSSDSEDDIRILNNGNIISHKHNERVTRSQTAEQRWKDFLKNGNLPKLI